MHTHNEFERNYYTLTHALSYLYYNIPLDSQYTLDTAVTDDIDELWHEDIEQLEQILDVELKETEWVNHELHSQKRNYS